MSNVPPILAASGQALPAWLAGRISSELQPGEVLVWTGRPIKSLAAKPAWIFSLIGGIMLLPMIAFAVVILGGCLILGWVAKQPLFGIMTFPMIFLLFGVLCILALLIAIPMFARSAADGTAYALTNRRAIVWEKTFSSFRVHSFGPTQLASMTRNEHTDGTGDLVFLTNHWRDSHGHHRSQPIGFRAIAGVQDIESLVRATLLPPTGGSC